MPPLNIPGFEILEKLGEGGMATVWKAHQLSLDRVVAIKVLSSRMTNDAGDVQRFQAEAQQAAKLKHPGIIQVYDASVLDGVYYFIMEYVAGYTVGEWVRRKGVLTEANALLVAEALADALDYAWRSAGMIHCDIKPDNVMLDEDGTVKLADLGLSRSFRGKDGGESTGEIMATPAYVSPEQAVDAPDLDCRADIYSLGAMLYHLVTGKMLFEGETEERVLELQLSGTVADPATLNPKLSRPMCRLIEKMLSKDKVHRQADWSAIRTDLALVRRGRPIVPPLPPPGASTVAREVLSEPSAPVPPAHRPTQRPGLPIGLWLALGVVGLAIVAFFLFQHSSHNRSPERPQHSGSHPPPEAVKPATQPAAHVAAKEAFAKAEQQALRLPLAFDQNIDLFRRVVAIAPQSQAARQAQAQISRLEALRRTRCGEVLNQLRDAAAPLLEAGQFEQAAQRYETYAGKLARETAAERQQIADDLRQRQRQARELHQQQARQAQGQYEALLDKIVKTLTSEGIAVAVATATMAEDDPQLNAKKEELHALVQLLNGAAQLDHRVMDSFTPSVGKEIDVSLNSGSKRLTIRRVRDGAVFGAQATGVGSRLVTVEISFEFKDLANKEILARLGADDDPQVALKKGLMALDAKAYEPARRFFGNTSPLLAERLVAVVDQSEVSTTAEVAKTAFLNLCDEAGWAVNLDERTEFLARLEQEQLPASKGPQILAMVESYRDLHGNSNFGREVEPLLAAMEQAAQREAPKPEQLMPAVPPRPVVNAKPADPRLIQDRLLQRNPQLDISQIEILANEEGIVQDISVISEGLEDISPLSTVTTRTLACSAVSKYDRRTDGPKCKLADLSPLKGAAGLESLFLGQARVQDLSPLKGLALRRLTIRSCPVADIKALRELPFLETLELRDTNVRDLAPLASLPLRSLDISASAITDINTLARLPLRQLDISDTQILNLGTITAMPLERLDLGGTRIFDFSPLRKLTSLLSLRLDNTQFKDVSMLRDMPLETLSMANTKVTDISALKGFPLVNLSLANCTVSDLSPLDGMNLTELNVGGSRVVDVSVLANMPLAVLDLSGTRVRDISALANMPLVRLHINNTAIRDLTPLIGSRIEYLDVRGTEIRDWTPLRRLPLISITVDDKRGAVRQILRQIPTLETVNGAPF